MIETSEFYKANILNKTTRWTAKIVVDYSDYNIDNTIAITIDKPNKVSFDEQIADGIETPTYKFWNWEDFAWGMHLMTSTDRNIEQGGISEQLSGADKEFKTRRPAALGRLVLGKNKLGGLSRFQGLPLFEVSFAERQVTTLRVVFDDKLVHYAEEFKIYIYQGATLASTEVVTGNTGTLWTKDLSSPLDDVTRLILEIGKWNVANSPARILEFYTSVQATYDQDEVLELSVLEESEPDKATTPIGNITSNTCELRILNKNSLFDNENEDSPLQGNLIKNRRLMPYIGLVGDIDEVGKQIWIPLGVYYSQQWNTNNYDMYAAVNGRDIIQLMAENAYTTSQFITPGADQTFTYTTTAEFAAFTLSNMRAADDALLFGGERWVFNTVAANALGELVLGKNNLASIGGNFYYGEAVKTITFTYTPGTSVRVVLNLDQTIETGDIVNYYISTDGGVIYELYNGTSFSYVPTTDSTSQNLNLKVEIITPNNGTATRIDEIEAAISGDVTLYSLAVLVANDFDDATGILEKKYRIDSELGEISIPNAYLQPQSYQAALRLICEAGAARAYADREGYLVIERAGKEPVYELERDNTSYLQSQNATNPQGLFNRVTTQIQPLTKSSTRETIAELSETIAASTVKTYTVFFTVDPSEDIITTGSTFPAGVSATSSTVYTWGADIEITNTNGTEQAFTLVVDGYTYEVRGAFESQLDDSESIRKNGVNELSINNPLIQTEAQADDIQELLIETYKNQARLIESDVIPDPSAEISDGIVIDEKGYTIFNQEIGYSRDRVLHILKGVKV